ncbi:MAG: hypothetical protein FJW26_21260 [Acidimicrobiia bacterium]|nr:hypothetical protein [Acidimicrobiia bacterium]
MSLRLSKREINLIYTLLRNSSDSILEPHPSQRTTAESANDVLLKTARLNKLIAANLRQKLQVEMAQNR